MGIVLSLIYVLMFNASLVIIFKTTFGKVLPLTFFISIISLFLSGILFNTFNVGFIINIIFTLFPIFYLIKFKDRRNGFLERYFSNGFYVFMTLYILTLFFDLNRTFTRWDEFSHWGEMVKEMFRLDKFYCVSGSVLQAHKDYPPAMSLFELLWIKLMGSYRESLIIQSLHLFEFSLFIPFISEKKPRLKRELIINSIFIFIMIFTLVVLFDQQGFINTIYIDYVLGMLCSYGIVSVLLQKDILSKISITNTCLTCSVLLLTKQMGLPFMLMVVFVYVMKLVFDKKIIKENIFKIVISLIIIVGIPLVFYKTWGSYSSSFEINPQFKLSDIKIEKLPGIIDGVSGKNYQKKTATNFLNALYATKITKGNYELTYVQSVFGVLALLYLVYLYEKENVKSFQTVGFLFLIGAVGYAFIMLNLYVFNFDQREGPILASYDRYMATYVIIGFSVVIMMFLNFYSKKKKLTYIPVLISLILFIFVSPESMDSFTPVLGATKVTIFQKEGAIIDKYTNNDKVYIIAQNSVGQYQFYLKYYANPIMVNLEDYDLEKEPTDDYKSEIKNKIDDYDYLFIASLDGTFFENYSSWFDSDICVGCMYKLENDKYVKLED